MEIHFKTFKQSHSTLIDNSDKMSRESKTLPII